MNDQIMRAKQWVSSEDLVHVDGQNYCETRDIFQARLDKMVGLLLNNSEIDQNTIYLLSAVAGEIGNNSFDHNAGNWPDITGVYYRHESNDKKLTIILADRGRGVLTTLKKVKPELQNDEQALLTAFNEKISGRAPESRGNGLKFVKESIKQAKSHLLFMSGLATARLNDKMEIEKSPKIKGCLAIISNEKIDEN